MTYEEMQLKYDDLYLKEMDLYQTPGLKGLYLDGCIAIEKRLTNTEKGCILAEELGHHYTSSGNILDQNDISNRKQERRARMWSYDKKIGLTGIIEAYKNGCHNRHEMAYFLDVTETYLSEALEAYRQHYGVCASIDAYIVYFEPGLGVVKMF